MIKIKLKNIKKSFKDKIVLNDISIELDAKSIILGNSGTGKTTLLAILGHLDKNYFGFIDVPRNCVSRFIYQKHNLIGHLTLYENIHVATGDKVKKPMIKEFIQKMGLQENTYPDKISIGQQQKIAVGRCLLDNPDYLFADEPTGDIDYKQAQPIIEMIKNIKYAVVATKGDFIIHSLQNRMTDEFTVYILRNGKLWKAGKITSPETLKEVGLQGWKTENDIIS